MPLICWETLNRPHLLSRWCVETFWSKGFSFLIRIVGPSSQYLKQLDTKLLGSEWDSEPLSIQNSVVPQTPETSWSEIPTLCFVHIDCYWHEVKLAGYQTVHPVWCQLHKDKHRGQKSWEEIYPNVNLDCSEGGNMGSGKGVMILLYHFSNFPQWILLCSSEWKGYF